MNGKILIVNNGLRNLRGHYFETAISVAEAVHQAGWEPILGVHSDCDASIVPEWLRYLPLCRTDHWMDKGFGRSVCMHGLRLDYGIREKISIDDVKKGKASIRDFLDTHFHPIDFPTPVIADAPPAHKSDMTSRFRHIVKISTPPIILKAASKLLREWSIRSRIKAVVKSLLPPIVISWIRHIKSHPSKDQSVITPTVFPETPPRMPSHQEILMTRLNAIGLEKEFWYAEIFAEDLNYLMCLSEIDARDHVFLPTAHPREIWAIDQLTERLPPEKLPEFHLEFRHALECDSDNEWEGTPRIHPYTEEHRIFFDFVRRKPLHPKIHFYTDTKELSDEYEKLSGIPFGTLPIPFRVQMLESRVRQAGEPITLCFAGDVRDEKGFPMLPKLIEAAKSRMRAGQIRFIIQATLVEPRYNPRSTETLEHLLKMQETGFELLGVNGPLSPTAYFQMISAADIMLCPYNAKSYRRRSSGTLTEAISLGIPTVVPAESWLAAQQPPGSGVVFKDEDEFVQKTLELIDNYNTFYLTAQQYKRAWLSMHTPTNLVLHLLNVSRQRQ